MRDALPDLAATGVAVIGISPDKVPQQKKFDDKHGLGFPLLSDADHRIAEAYGVWAEKKMYGKTTMGIVRSAFLIDENGNIIKNPIVFTDSFLLPVGLQIWIPMNTSANGFPNYQAFTIGGSLDNQRAGGFPLAAGLSIGSGEMDFSSFKRN